MRVTATDAAVAIVDRARGARSGALTITIGTGCCESTAPFLYEDFWPGPDQEVVGDVDGVPVYAPEYLRKMYPGDEGVVIDLAEDMFAESLSIETEWECRLILRGHGVDTGTAERCAVPATMPRAPGAAVPGAEVRGQMPEALRRMRMR